MDEVLRFLGNIFLIIYHLNRWEIFHSDLKPTNFFIRKELNGNIYLHLRDFGTAKNINPDSTRLITHTGGIKGAVEYLAPEILNARLAKPNISKQDIWSMGVIMYQLVTLRLPFQGQNHIDTCAAIINDPHEPIPEYLCSDKELIEIINQLLTKDPDQRPSIDLLPEDYAIKMAIDLLPREFDGKAAIELKEAGGYLYRIGGVTKTGRANPCRPPMINLPESDHSVKFVYLWGERLYTETNNTLYVYSVDYHYRPSATFTLGVHQKGYSALITDNRLYIGATSELHIFEVTSSLEKPLIPVTKIPIKLNLFKILRVGDNLLLG